MSFKLNPLLNADSYKFNHINMYPSGITEVYSNFTPRSVKHLNVPSTYKKELIVWFGGQAVIQDMVDMWDEHFFKLNTSADFVNGSLKMVFPFIEKFKKTIAPFAGVDYPTEHLESLWKLGYLPIEVKTLPEGALVPVGVPVLTIRNTRPEFFWLTNFLETWLSAELWQMSTSATIAWYYRQIGNFWYEKTGANKGFLDFAFHDFSLRGQTSMISGAKSGAGHLTSFKGTDTIPAVPYLEYHYSGKETFVGASVPATEHSIQTAFVEDDKVYLESMLDAYPTGIVSCVVDGYDYWNVITNILPQLKDKIMTRQPDAMGFNKLVVRPDSGDPVRIVAGYSVGYFESEETAEFYISSSVEYDKAYEYDLYEIDGVIYEVDINRYPDFSIWSIKFEKTKLTEAEVKGSIQCLWETFGGTTNDKGYKTLDQHIGLIYGDSITMERADEILRRLEERGFSADNVVFGVGSYTYQMVSRDTLGYAMKATNIRKDGVDIPLFKDPKTDNGTKKSAKGLLSVVRTSDADGMNASYKLIDNVTREQEATGELTTMFKDGTFLKHETLEEIRNRLLNG